MCKGSFSVTVNAVTRTVAAGEVTVADSFDAHSYTQLEDDSLGYVIILKKDYLSDYYELTKARTLVQNFISDEEFFAEAKPLFERLYHLNGQAMRPPTQLYRKALATAILSLVASYAQYEERSFKDESPKIRDILKYIYENSHRNITLNSLAKEFGYTPTHFSHIFNKSAGFKLKDYLNRTRALSAAALISNGVPLTRAAFDSGFESLSSFYRVFKQVHGMSPKQFVTAHNSPQA